MDHPLFDYTPIVDRPQLSCRTARAWLSTWP